MLGPKIEISLYNYVPLYLLFILFILQEIVLQLSLAYLVECVLSARGAGTMSALMSSLAHVLQMMASSAATRLMQQTFAMCETQRLISTSNVLPPPPLKTNAALFSPIICILLSDYPSMCHVMKGRCWSL